MPFASAPLRLLATLLLASSAALLNAATPPAELLAALASFRTEGPTGWSFTQTTTDGEHSLVETFDPLQPEPLRWTLLSRDGRMPDEDDREQYRRSKLVRTSALDAPRIERQLDTTSCEILSEDDRHLVCRFPLRPGEQHDDAWRNLLVTLRLDRPARTIVEVVIENREPFSPVFGIRIQHTRTVLAYGLPSDGAPGLLLRATIRLEGRAFWVRSLDQSLEIRRESHRRAVPLAR